MERSFKLRLISTLSFTLGTILIIGIVVFYLGFDISKKGTLILNINTKLLQARNNISDLAKLKEQEKEADIALFKLNNALPKRDSLFGRALLSLKRAMSASFSCSLSLAKSLILFLACNSFVLIFKISVPFLEISKPK